MAKTPNISEELKGEIRIIGETALQIRDEVSSPSLKAELDRALADLEEIPRLFDSEDYMRQALKLPNARIRRVVRIKESHGPDARLVPDDLGHP
jgi:hypothetical protein